MDKFDGRKLDHKTREAIRKRAVQRILDGESPEVIAKNLGYHRSAVCQWMKRYSDAGETGLAYRKIPGAKPRLFVPQSCADCQSEVVINIYAELTCPVIEDLLDNSTTFYS